MTKRLRIDFVSDVSCPWCAIGLAGLEEALKRLDEAVDVDVHVQPFELNPQMVPEGENLAQHLGRKLGSTPEQSAAARKMIRERAAGVGFTMAVDENSRIYNTFDAHRLLHWADLEGKGPALKRRLFEVYFTEQNNPADHAVLTGAAGDVGLDPAEAREVLASGRYAEEVRAAERQWQAAGVTAVPSVIIDGRYLIQGGQPPEAFEQALREIAAQTA